MLNKFANSFHYLHQQEDPSIIYNRLEVSFNLAFLAVFSQGCQIPVISSSFYPAVFKFSKATRPNGEGLT